MANAAPWHGGREYQSTKYKYFAPVANLRLIEVSESRFELSHPRSVWGTEPIGGFRSKSHDGKNSILVTVSSKLFASEESFYLLCPS